MTYIESAPECWRSAGRYIGEEKGEAVTVKELRKKLELAPSDMTVIVKTGPGFWSDQKKFDIESAYDFPDFWVFVIEPKEQEWTSTTSAQRKG